MTRKRAGARCHQGTNGAVAIALLAAACAGRGLQSPPSPQVATFAPQAARSAPQVATPTQVAPAGRAPGDASGAEAAEAEGHGADRVSQEEPGTADERREVADTPAPRTWVKVPGGAILKSRTHGSDHIEPDEATRAALAKAGRHASGTFRLCLDDRGEVVLARAMIETGFPAYDEKILGEIRAWRFHPYVIDGQPSGVCSEISVTSPTARTARRR